MKLSLLVFFSGSELDVLGRASVFFVRDGDFKNKILKESFF